jgi:transcriptional regulator of heat shock response
MQLTLSENDARMLRDFLRDHLRDVTFEAARTEERTLRHTLLEMKNLIERLLALLDQEVPKLV